MARKRSKRAARPGQGLKDANASARRALYETRMEQARRRGLSVLSQTKARAAEKTFDQKRFITEPAKQAPKVVAKAQKDVRKRVTPVDTPQKIRPTCKKRPDSKTPSSRGSGKAREFVPWCR